MWDIIQSNLIDKYLTVKDRINTIADTVLRTPCLYKLPESIKKYFSCKQGFKLCVANGDTIFEMDLQEKFILQAQIFLLLVINVKNFYGEKSNFGSFV